MTRSELKTKDDSVTIEELLADLERATSRFRAYVRGEPYVDRAREPPSDVYADHHKR